MSRQFSHIQVESRSGWSFAGWSGKQPGNGIIPRQPQTLFRAAMIQDISAELTADARHQLGHPQLARTLRAHCGYLPDSVRAGDIDTTLHPACQMLAHSLRHHQDAALAVTQYFSVALQQYHVAAQIIDRHPVEHHKLRFLDFACGYGRLLNFLIHKVPPEHIWAAEILPEAVTWVAERYGVHGLPSSPQPEDFDPGERFDLIWVASLFSHLPADLFRRWIKQLEGLLTPQGILCFTVHDEALLPADMPIPESGILFIEGSENAELSPAIYGTTFVSENFVRDAVAQAVGAGRPYLRFPRRVAYEQDVYLLARTPGSEPAGLAEIRHGLRGWVDELSIDGHGVISLSGWAASMDGDTPADIEILIGGKTHQCGTGEPRPRVATVLDRPDLSHCGWSCRLSLPPNESEPYLTITARSERDHPALIFAGAIGNPVK